MNYYARILLFSSFLILAFSKFSFAIETNDEMWPGTVYDKNIPTHKQILGYEAGEKISSYEEMLSFFEALQKAAPDRLKLMEYGKTWEGRKLVYVIVASKNNLDKIDQFSKDMQALANASETHMTKANQLVETLPSSVWLQYGVHGNEISSTDAAMMTAYHLLAAPEDAINRKILANSIVFIDPLQNPDGRARFTSRYYATVGIQHSSDRYSAEHNEPWPNGRTNHYLFDMNRDWLTLTQPESKARVKVMQQYFPLVVIDLHEMGGDSSYYFAPAADPFNPHLEKNQLDNMATIGKNNGKHFDSFGFDYFTREVFDAFYPGYGDSWPAFYGAVTSTYEVSSSRGEIFAKRTGEEMSYRDTVKRHFVASISTAESVADNREKLLKDFYRYQVTAINSGKSDRKERVFVIADKVNRSGAHRLATLMAEHGVVVNKALKPFTSCGKRFDAGSFFIDTAQPRGRFVKTSLTRQVDMDYDFLKEQERRRDRKLEDQIYDVTGWSLPLMFNVETHACAQTVNVKSERLSANVPLIGSIENPDARVAYIVSWGDVSAGRFLTSALKNGLVVKSADQAFTVNDKNYPAGSLIIERRRNDVSVKNIVSKIAKETGALVDGIDTSWVTKGPSFGSENTVTLIAPKVAMAWDEPTSVLNAGAARFVIERQFNYPVTAIKSQHLSRADLSKYHVLILPSANYSSVINESASNVIKDWVKAGGVLITLDQATRYAVESKLLDVQKEYAYKEDKKAEGSNDIKTQGKLYHKPDDLIDAIENPNEDPDRVSGVLANVVVDQAHWLTAGVKENLVALVRGNDIYSPIKLQSGKNLVWFDSSDNVLASGYLWKENRAQLAYKPFLIHQPTGKGMIISFTQDPVSRASLDGLNVLFLNSIFRSPAHSSKVH